jgi:hypothetical protein
MMARAASTKPTLDSLGAGAFSGFGASEGGRGSMEAILAPSMPSARLEQDAQILGFLDKALPGLTMGSPQQMQMLGFTKQGKQPIWKSQHSRQKTNPKKSLFSGTEFTRNPWKQLPSLPST